MRFLSPNKSTGTINFDRYFEYIESMRDRLSEEAYRFASNYDHYNLESKKSLHDSWVRSINIEETPPDAESEMRRLNVHVSLLGPWHDCLLHLSYRGVTGYTMSATCKKTGRTPHGDILIHEISVTDDRAIIHEILFESGAVLVVHSADLRFRVEPLGTET